MSNRLINQETGKQVGWQPNSELAFGEPGKKGDQGEIIVQEYFQSIDYSCKIHKDQAKQVVGVDVEFKNPDWHNSYTGDVKANMDRYGGFFVYDDWLNGANKTSDRIIHVNVDTKWICFYGREEMQFFWNMMKEEGPHLFKKDKKTGVEFLYLPKKALDYNKQHFPTLSRVIKNV